MPEALEQIRLRAIDGLLALPKVGMAVGGLLTGRREASRIVIVGSTEIECSYSAGPGFQLTPAELSQARQFAGHNDVVGWYCSRPRGQLSLDNNQEAVFRELCPEPWHVGWLIRPSTVEPTSAVLCRWDNELHLVTGMVQEVREINVVEPPEPLAANPALPLAAAPEPPVTRSTRDPDVDTPRLDAPELQPLKTQPPSHGGDEAVTAPATASTIQIPAFARAEPKARLAPRLRIALAALVLLGAGAGYGTRLWWMPRPALVLTAQEAGGTVTIRWNTEALAGIDGGSILINDGGEPETIPLDQPRLQAGFVKYDRKSERVFAKLVAGDVNGLTEWIAPLLPASPPVNADEAGGARGTGDPGR